jgi:hypothetical protein
MRLQLAAARRRLGEMGRSEMVTESDRWFADHGVRNPEAWTRMLIPGTFTGN